MNWKRVLGIALIVISCITAWSNVIITGAVIGYSLSLSFIAILTLIAGIIMMLADKEDESELEESVKEALKRGISEADAKNLISELNKKVEVGKWVELRAFRVRATSNPEQYPHATSICRYWGPKEYENLPNVKLDNLYKKGEIGKTHELMRGSDKYKEGGSLVKATVSMPQKGSRVLHRHWELAEMYKYRKSK